MLNASECKGITMDQASQDSKLGLKSQHLSGTVPLGDPLEKEIPYYQDSLLCHNPSLAGKGPQMQREFAAPSMERLRASVERSQHIAPPLVSERLLPMGFVREGRFTLRPIWHPDSDVLRRIDIHRS